MTDRSKTIPAYVRWTFLAIALAAVLVAVVWAGPAPASAQEPSSCDPARPHDAGTFADQTITTTDGFEREYILHVPPSYTGAWAMPLVFNFHGFTMTAGLQARYTDLNANADGAGFIAVTPQGLSTENIEPFHWNNRLSLESGEPDDVAFVSELLDELGSTLCVDTARVYSTGYSNGGFMSVRLACSLSDRIAAIAPVAGAYFPPFSDDSDPNESCPDTRPVPVIAFHGSADPIVPFEGGLGGLVAASIIFRLSIEDAISEWAAHNGCEGVPAEEQATQNVRLIRHQGCNEGATVELYVVEGGGGHTWPDATLDFPEDILGVTTHEISANDLMWDFFLAHPMPGAPPLAPLPDISEALDAPTSGTGPALAGTAVPVWLMGMFAASAIALGAAAGYAGRRLR